MIRALVVDDEPLARRRVAALLAEEPDCRLCGEAGHGAQAIAMIADAKPDLVFLDIQMPEINGFDVLAAIGAEAMPATVFVTAFDSYALKAFEVQALDYLLKPFDDARFHAVLARARQQVALQRATGSGQAFAQLVSDLPPRLISRSRGVTKVIACADIDWIGAAGDYAEVHTLGRSLLVDESLAALTKRLPPQQFARVHRSAIVRLDRIRDATFGAHGDGRLALLCGTEVRVSRRYRQALDLYLSR